MFDTYEKFFDEYLINRESLLNNRYDPVEAINNLLSGISAEQIESGVIGGGVSKTQGIEVKNDPATGNTSFQSRNFVSGSAGWNLKDDGTIEASSLTLYGGTIKYGKTAFDDAVNAGYWIGASGLYFGAAADATYIKYSISAATFVVKAAVTTITGSSLDGQYLTNLSVQTGALANLAVTAAKIDNATITATQIANATITATQIANGTITTTQISGTAGITGGQIANGTITTTQISGTAGITGGQIATGTIVAGNIQNLTITAAQIANLTITATQVANATLTNTQIAQNTITGGATGNIALTSITADNIAALTITASQIAANTITAAKIAANTITASQIAANTITANELATSITYAGSIIIDTAGLIRSGQTAYDTGTGWWIGNVTGTPKLSIGISTGNKITWDGTNLKVIGYLQAVAGDSLLVSANTERNTLDTSYIQIKQITIQRGGQYRIKFDMKRGAINDTDPTVYGRIYKNDVAVGTERSTSGATYTTYSEDISDFSIGDTIDLYIHASSGVGGTPTACYVQNFRIYVLNSDATSVDVD